MTKKKSYIRLEMKQGQRDGEKEFVCSYWIICFMQLWKGLRIKNIDIYSEYQTASQTMHYHWGSGLWFSS